MSRHSSIRRTWTQFRSRNSKPAVGVRKLVRVQMQVVERLDVVAARGAQKPSPERAQVIPSRTQMLMVVIRNEPQVAQPELRNDARNPVGHRKQGRGEADVLAGRVPGDDECISHQLNCPFTREQAHRGWWTTLPRRIALRSLPPCLALEVDIGEEKRTPTRPPTCGSIQRHPKIAMYPHHLRQRARLALSDHLRRLHDKSLVEFVYELETRATRPRRGHE